MFRKLMAYIVYGASILLIVFSIFGSHGAVQLGKLIKDERGLEKKQLELSKAVGKSKVELIAIENDSGELERRVRNDLGLSREDEILYIDNR